MNNSAPVEYENLEIHGPILVEEIDESDNDKLGWGFVILLMGPVGSGKSTFIEKLSLNGGTKIELPSSTQSIIPYRIKNVTWQGHAIHIVGVPGFADDKTSEIKMVSLLTEWMKNAGIQVFYHIIYLTPIYSVRLPGSQRRALKSFQSFTGVGAATNITIATTKWDINLGEAAARRAEERFNQLRNDTWRDFTDAGSELVRFHNTPEYALSILDTVASRYDGAVKFHLEDMVIQKQHLTESPFAPHFLNDLQHRIENLTTCRVSLQSEIEDATARSDMRVMSIVIPELKEVEQALHRFQEELREFRRPPTPASDDFDVVSQVHDLNIAATQIPIPDSDNDVVHGSTIYPGPPLSVPSTLPRETDNGAHDLQHDDSDVAPQVPEANTIALEVSLPDSDNDNAQASAIISTVTPQDNRTPEVLPRQRGIFARATGWVKHSVRALNSRRRVDKN